MVALSSIPSNGTCKVRGQGFVDDDGTVVPMAPLHERGTIVGDYLVESPRLQRAVLHVVECMPVHHFEGL